MTGLKFAELVRYYTKTNSTTLPDSELVLLANMVKDDFAKEIVKLNEDVFGVPATRDLVASSTTDPSKREYSLPEDIIRMKFVEAKLDGTNWIHLDEMDLNTYKRSTNESQILNIFANEDGHAFYDIFRNSLWIYSGTLTAVTGGLKLWYTAFPADITAGTLAAATDLSIDPSSTTSQIPRLFHELWARKISITIKTSKDKPIPLTEKEVNFGSDWESAMETLRGINPDHGVVGALPDDTRMQQA